MKNVLFPLLCILMACHSRPSGIIIQSHNSADSPQVVTTALTHDSVVSTLSIPSYNVPDSLQIVLAWLERDSLSARSVAVDQYSVAVIRWHQDKLAVCSDHDGLSFVLQKSGKQWRISHTLSMTQIWEISATDINGDGYMDILLNDFPTIHSNSFCTPLLSDATGKLSLREDCTMMNMRYHRSTRTIRTEVLGGVLSPVSKEEYKWLNDSLQLIRGVELIPDGNTRQPMYDLNFYHFAHDKEVIDMHLRGPKVDQIYYKAFWPIME